MTPNRRKGLILVATSALLFSTPGLFTRGVNASGWDVTFWRGLFGACFAVLFLVYKGTLKFELKTLGWPGLVTAAIGATSSIAFIQSFKITTIANVSMIYGSAPLVTALLAWFWLREKPRHVVMFSSVVAFLGVVMIGFGSLGSSHIWGDILAAYMTVTFAIVIVMFRKFPQIPATATTVVTSLFALSIAGVMGNPFTVSPHEIAILAVFGAVFALAATLLSEGSKHIASGEAALLSNLEVPIQPVLAWLIFAEWPPSATFLGGALILFAILVSQWPRSSSLSPKA
jgi:drug/metabolite transporter (DMT)-like permease